MADSNAISRIILFLTSLGFINYLLPASIQFITIASFAWFTGGTVAVAGACVIATGLPCAAAIAIYTAITAILTYFNTGIEWVTTLILTPISIFMIMYVVRLARGSA